MSAMLASVNSLPEALLLQGFAADIIDLKQPEQGALGALETEVVAQIVQALAPETTVSATIGDMAMQPQTVFDAVQAMAATGVDFVKIGLFPEGDTLATIQRLAAITQQGTALIAVLFADAKPDFEILDALATAGFRGAMLDTMHKGQGSLTDVLSLTVLNDFVQRCANLGLLSGLAGSLRESDVTVLSPLNLDYLGFRGALCQQQSRTAQLDRQQIARIRYLVK